MGIDTQPGEDFEAVLNEAVESADVIIAVIGRPERKSTGRARHPAPQPTIRRMGAAGFEPATSRV
jgi:hypothetical protein